MITEYLQYNIRLDVVIEETGKWTYKGSGKLGSEDQHWGVEGRHYWLDNQEEDQRNNEEVWH